MVGGCSLWGFGASTVTLQHHSDLAMPQFSEKSTPTRTGVTKQCKGAPICPSTASQGTQTHFLHPIWMWDVVNGGFQPQPYDTATSYRLGQTPFFLNIHPNLHNVFKA